MSRFKGKGSAMAWLVAAVTTAAAFLTLLGVGCGGENEDECARCNRFYKTCYSNASNTSELIACEDDFKTCSEQYPGCDKR